MANINSPQGFIPAMTPNARKSAYTIASTYGTDINIGDPVKLSGTGTDQYPGIIIGTTGADVVGVFAGCEYVDSNGVLQRGSWIAGTTATNIICEVYDDPMTEFVAQITTIAVTDYGNKVGFAAGSGTGTPKVSGYYLDGATIGSSNDFQIRRILNTPGNNTVGAYAMVQGAFRLHSYNYPYTVV